MKRRFSFHEKAFKELSSRQQHKKCAEVIRELYTTSNEILWIEYNKLLGWMEPRIDLPQISLYSKETLSDLYHKHLKIAEISLQEADFLPKVQIIDKLEASPWLGITTLLDRIRSLHNIGSIMRTIEAFRLGPMVLSDESFDIDIKRLNKSAMGSESEVRFVKQSDCSEEILKTPLIALETIENATPYYSFSFPEECTIIVGNEESGISEKLLKKADHCISIPLRGKKNSLNVANAFAIVAAEIAAQRTRHK